MAIYKLSRRKFLIVAGSLAAVSLAKGKVIDIKKAIDVERTKSKYRWAMFVDAEKCTKCIKELYGTLDPKKLPEDVKPPCVKACDYENNIPQFKDPLRTPHWIKIIEVEPEYGGSPIAMPVMCNHCEYPACAKVCPTKATFKRPDGIVLIDYHRCIGCRYCMIACPYGARSFNWYEPLEGLPNHRPTNPLVPTRGHGIVEKCTFCVQIVDREVYLAEKEGRKPRPVPACVRACKKEGKGALVFGNILDPTSEIYKMITKYRVIQLRPEFGTDPHVYYRL